MASVSALATFFSEWTPTTWSVVILLGSILCVAVVTLVKIWPVLKGKINEARKIELDANAEFRGDLLDRIKVLELGRDGDQQRLSDALSAERRRCDGELADMRRDFEKRIDELMRIITQNSQSTAQMLGNPGAVATSKAMRKEPRK